MNIRDAVEHIEGEYNIRRSEELARVARSVAHLQD